MTPDTAAQTIDAPRWTLFSRHAKPRAAPPRPFVSRCERNAMLASLKALIADLTGGGQTAERFAGDDYRLAATALLVHAAGIDGNMSETERSKLRSLLKERFGLDDEATSALITEATAAEHEAVDLYRFTSNLNRTLDDEGRQRIVEMMWEIIYADGRLNEFEDNLVWRAADLLNVPSRIRVEIRQRVAGPGAEPDATD
jgi:uncharacterized tellurite resistance protein B-like protein